MPKSQYLRTWVEIDSKALKRNIFNFRKIIGLQTKLMAVVKSNAYGHGLLDFVSEVSKFQIPNSKFHAIDWYGVDSIVEALALRRNGLRKPILVLGYTLPQFFTDAAKQNISLTISTFENVKALAKLKKHPSTLLRASPKIHIKIDTGMHRQGFLLKQVPEVIRELSRAKLFKEVEGVFTHFASAKDITYPFYTKEQIKEFEKAYLEFVPILSSRSEETKSRIRDVAAARRADDIGKAAGFLPFLRHASASGGALLYPEAHYDMVRIGIGLYGLWPSKEAEIQFGLSTQAGAGSKEKFKLQPILTWKTIVSEVKKIPASSYIGYDLTEKVLKPTKIAVLPVGYWHGIDRGLSNIGEVLIGGKRRKILGRISMDMITVDVTHAPKVKVGDEAVLIGKQGKENIGAVEWAEKLDTTPYEILTRINPLIKRIYIG